MPCGARPWVDAAGEGVGIEPTPPRVTRRRLPCAGFALTVVAAGLLTAPTGAGAPAVSAFHAPASSGVRPTIRSAEHQRAPTTRLSMRSHWWPDTVPRPHRPSNGRSPPPSWLAASCFPLLVLPAVAAALCHSALQWRGDRRRRLAPAMWAASGESSPAEIKTVTFNFAAQMERMMNTPTQPEEQPQLAPTGPFRQPTKFIVVVGGVCSSLGKGVTCSSLGAVLRANGYHVTAVKIDPYVNTDAGLMSPYEHGEVFVLDDGGEVDLDLGNYERTIGLHLTRLNNITTGKVYSTVIDNERKGKYLGKTVQMIPHVSGEIVDQLLRVAQISTDGTGERPQICLVELGGTVGDIESMLFLEALRTLKYTVGPENFCLMQCSLVPIMSGTQKTKPTQHTVRSLQALGLQPDVIVCRCEEPIQEATRQKISMQCGVTAQAVLSVHNVPNLYDVPALLADGGAMNLLTAVLRLDRLSRQDRRNGGAPTALTVTMEDWVSLARRKATATQVVTIAMVAKYTEKDTEGRAYTGDTYLSVLKALEHAAIAVNRKLAIVWVDSGEFEAPEGSKVYQEAIAKLKRADGVLIPGGFGDRGVQGKALAANWARRNRKPFLGICLGFQMAIVGFCRDALGIHNATSEEFDPEGQGEHVLKFMPDLSKEYMGATMVLGARTIKLTADSLTSRLYGGMIDIEERQRHRYEVSKQYIPHMEAAGLRFVGRDTSGLRMEVFELDPEVGHPFFVGLQCHPEFKSRPSMPSPPFLGFLHAAVGTLEEGLKSCASRGPLTHYRPGRKPSSSHM
jgi:CTP synthase